MEIKICPAHSIKMVPYETRYGIRHQCPECDIYCWDSPTSTPGTPATHEYRKKAHAAFDPLWKFHRKSRGKCYRQLAAFMNLAPKDTHIGMFDIPQCKQVIAFAALKDGSTKNYDGSKVTVE